MLDRLRNIDKIWIIPAVLFLLIIGLFILTTAISPVPVFIYPIL